MGRLRDATINTNATPSRLWTSCFDPIRLAESVLAFYPDMIKSSNHPHIQAIVTKVQKNNDNSDKINPNLDGKPLGKMLIVSKL